MKLRLPLGTGFVVASYALMVGGCSGKLDGSSVSARGPGADGASAGSSSATGGNGSGGSSGSTPVGGFNPVNLQGGDTGMAAGTGLGGGTGIGGGGSAEVCDGLDNDNDGIIDDLDKNGDGVCDCLLIATLGVKGTSGQGDVFATWLSARSDTGATDLADQTLTPELLAKYQVIVAQNVANGHQYTAAEVTALSDWVNKGGGFMTLIGYQGAGEAHNVNQLLAPFTMSYTDQQILSKGNGASTIPITMWTPHPIDMGVTAVGVDNGYPVQGMGDTIATGGGFDVAKVQVVGKGHVFLWGDEWITYNSEWVDHPDYQVQLLWLNSIKWLTVAGQCQVAIPPNPPK